MSMHLSKSPHTSNCDDDGDTVLSLDDIDTDSATVEEAASIISDIDWVDDPWESGEDSEVEEEDIPLKNTFLTDLHLHRRLLLTTQNHKTKKHLKQMQLLISRDTLQRYALSGSLVRIVNMI